MVAIQLPVASGNCGPGSAARLRLRKPASYATLTWEQFQILRGMPSTKPKTRTSRRKLPGAACREKKNGAETAAGNANNAGADLSRNTRLEGTPAANEGPRQLNLG